MAEVIKSVIGKLSGTLGNMVFRNIGDKVVVYMRPHNQQISYSEESVKNRGKFGLTTLFAKNVRLLPGIEEVWESSNAPGRSTYTKLIKANSKFTTSERITLSNNITPIGNGINVNNYSLSCQRFDIEYSFDIQCNEKMIAPFNANLLIFLHDLKNPETGAKYYFVRESIEMNDQSLTENKKTEFIFNEEIRKNIHLYNNAIIFFTVTKLVNKAVYWTTNFKAEIAI